MISRRRRSIRIAKWNGTTGHFLQILSSETRSSADQYTIGPENAHKRIDGMYRGVQELLQNISMPSAHRIVAASRQKRIIAMTDRINRFLLLRV